MINQSLQQDQKFLRGHIAGTERCIGICYPLHLLSDLLYGSILEGWVWAFRELCQGRVVQLANHVSMILSAR